MVTAVALLVVLALVAAVWWVRRRPATTGERCEVCGAALTARTQVEVLEHQTGDAAAVEIAQMGGGSFLAAYFCRDHAPANMEA